MGQSQITNSITMYYGWARVTCTSVEEDDDIFYSRFLFYYLRRFIYIIEDLYVIYIIK